MEIDKMTANSDNPTLIIAEKKVLYKVMRKMGFVGGLLFNYLKENIAPKLVPTPDWD